ncbi:21 kDa protein-like [Lotus japonicus]|uniref:21 kDa protein-like n=1 Tax=Lotus japonicus TaxID=34305 RepID=UPI00258A2C73|nr:21 kDa protein-like [Lotus japonicus]
MEAISSSKHLIITTLLIIVASSFSFTTEATEKPYQQASTVFIKTSCSSTTYPRLCFASLVKHAESIQNDRLQLTCTALNVTLAAAKSTSAMISTMAKKQGMKPREVAAMQDCVEVLSDSVDELRRSIAELGNLKTSNFEMTMSDVQTWVSAALTDESTCTDGFQQQQSEDAVNEDDKSAVRVRVVQTAQLTSNALALINRLASSRG